ncbi:MAG: hypothetical protein ACYDGX_07840 [Thermoleophilia bacterium]
MTLTESSSARARPRASTIRKEPVIKSPPGNSVFHKALKESWQRLGARMAMDTAAVESVSMIEFCPYLELPQWNFCLTIIGDDSFCINPDLASRCLLLSGK